MVWFEKSIPNKKSQELEAEKTFEVPKPAAATTFQSTSADSPAVGNAPEAASTISATSLVGCLYKGSRVNGQLTFQGPARIDGIVEGDIQCKGALVIGESAEVKAKITAQTVVIHGKVEGNVSAKEKIELIAPARLIGNIDTPRLVITEGVVFDGDCSMGVVKPKGGVAGLHNNANEGAALTQSAKS